MQSGGALHASGARQAAGGEASRRHEAVFRGARPKADGQDDDAQGTRARDQRQGRDGRLVLYTGNASERKGSGYRNVPGADSSSPLYTGSPGTCTDAWQGHCTWLHIKSGLCRDGRVRDADRVLPPRSQAACRFFRRGGLPCRRRACFLPSPAEGRLRKPRRHPIPRVHRACRHAGRTRLQGADTPRRRVARADQPVQHYLQGHDAAKLHRRRGRRALRAAHRGDGAGVRPGCAGQGHGVQRGTALAGQRAGPRVRRGDTWLRLRRGRHG